MNITFITTVLAACFSIVIVGLDAKAVRDGIEKGDNHTSPSPEYEYGTKYGVLGTQLGFACASFLVCCAFIIMYIFVLIILQRLRRQQPKIINHHGIKA